jgi:hypothetical protein
MFSRAHASFLALVLALPVLTAGTAMAKSGVNIGTLSCTVDGGVGLILGSSKKMTCKFDPSGKGHKQNYSGTIGKLGVDIGITGKSYIAWLVFAPGNVKAGALAGSYGGVSAQASVGLGLGANVLVGGSNKSIALQPVSVEGQTGLNVAAGLTSITLKYVK